MAAASMLEAPMIEYTQGIGHVWVGAQGMTLTRGDGAALTLDMESLQVAYVSAIAAAGGCQVSDLRPDTTKIDMAIFHTSKEHIGDETAELRVQLKSTYAQDFNALLNTTATHFSYVLDNKTFERMSAVKVTIPRALFVMILPRDPDDWTQPSERHLSLAHHCYFVNMKGLVTTGVSESSIRVSIANRLDAHSLSALMMRIGRGEEV